MRDTDYSVRLLGFPLRMGAIAIYFSGASIYISYPGVRIHRLNQLSLNLGLRLSCLCITGRI